MTNMERVIHDPGEADEARYDAHEEFVTELQRRDRTHLVTPEALGRWYNAAKGALDTPLTERIRAEFGEPERTDINDRKTT